MRAAVDPVYRIVGWSERFENHRSKPLKSTTWVPIPNKFDSDGYTKLLESRNGVAHYGAWITILQLSSRSQIRGTLIRGNGKPHTPETMSRITGVSAKLYSVVLKRLLDDEIGWIEEVPPEQLSLDLRQLARETAPAARDSAPLARSSAVVRARAVGTERNGSEGKRTEPDSRPSWGNPPPADDPRQIQYLQVALSDLMDGELGMPDPDVVKNTLRKAGGATADEVRQVFQDLRNQGRICARGWAWFPAAAEGIFQNSNGTDGRV